MTNKLQETPITTREKITIRLVLFLIQMIHPYEYEHQFKEYFSEMKELISLTPKKHD